MADLLIRGGLVVDGTGAEGAVGDVGVRDGRIVPPDVLDARPDVIDADGLVVAPGFIDLHTHYDAQLFWDRTASPSPLHGVTTVLGGNCGFTLAPAGSEHAPYLMRMMARVEGMPLPALEAGLDWSWTSHESWMEHLDGGIAVNAGFLVGHSAVRRAVMGEGCHDPATEDQIAEMARVVADACAAGALGFSTSTATTHNDGDGDPVPSRGAAAGELVALAAAVSTTPGTTLEAILAGCINGFTDDDVELLGDMSIAAGHPVNWNVLGVSTLNPEGHVSQLAASDTIAARGGRLVALTLPHSMRVRLSFLSGTILDGLPGWREVMALPVEARVQALVDPETRRRLRKGAASDEAGVLRAVADWPRLTVLETFAPEHESFEGRTIRDIARELGRDDHFDVLLDIVVADRLRTGLGLGDGKERAPEWELRAEVWRDPRTVIGGSDAGAHLDMMCGAIYSTALLAHGVREFQVITLEDAVRHLTDVPARLYGLTGRGRIADGYAADITIFDPERVGYEPERMRDDLPGGASRLYAESVGVHHVLVNGQPIVTDGTFTDATPGTLLRAGRDTHDVTP